MSVIDGFEMGPGKKTSIDKPFITVRNASITFSKAAVEAIGFPAFVRIFFGEKTHQFAVVPCRESDEGAYDFYKKPEKGRSMLVRISAKNEARRLMDMAGLKDCKSGKRFYGKYIESEKTLLFEINNDSD